MLLNLPKKVHRTQLFDGRFKKHQISIDSGASSIKLTALSGASTVAAVEADGFCRFADDIPAELRTAVARELNLDLFPQSQLTHVVVEGPDPDPESLVEFVGAGLECDQIWETHLESNTEFCEQFDRFGNWELPRCIDFARTAATFVREGHKQGGACSFHIHKSWWGSYFTVMVGLNFLELVDERYRMVIPPKPSIERIARSLMLLLESEDVDQMLHPERYLVTVSEYRAKRLCEQLRRAAHKPLPLESTPKDLEMFGSTSLAGKSMEDEEILASLPASLASNYELTNLGHEALAAVSAAKAADVSNSGKQESEVKDDACLVNARDQAPASISSVENDATNKLG
jgi:hypothetical protein